MTDVVNREIDTPRAFPSHTDTVAQGALFRFYVVARAGKCSVKTVAVIDAASPNKAGPLTDSRSDSRYRRSRRYPSNSNGVTFKTVRLRTQLALPD
jgi:hypothetical protein